MFGFIGIAVLIFLWSAPSDGFGAPPLFFRVFGSFIALAFMAMGFGLPISALLSRSDSSPSGPDSLPLSDGAPSERQVGYRCPHCGAGLGKDQEVSPQGDIKCTYCHKWWNIHSS
jgi:DNA-directed RNA polymerase subunit RPC12/RpoP